MSKLRRFAKHLRECFVTGEKDFFTFRMWRLVYFLTPIILVIAPWFVPALSKYALWICVFGIVWLLLRAFWHSFELYDALNEKTKPRLEILNSPPQDSRDQINRVWQIQVRNISSGDIEQCSVRLNKIERYGELKWGGQNVPLAFQPNEEQDATSKTIRPDTTELLDVIFWGYSSKEFFPPRRLPSASMYGFQTTI